jgi:hypothetical protein
MFSAMIFTTGFGLQGHFSLVVVTVVTPLSLLTFLYSLNLPLELGQMQY